MILMENMESSTKVLNLNTFPSDIASFANIIKGTVYAYINEV